jgi:Spy/CpxP family protein refolding chaperone
MKNRVALIALAASLVLTAVVAGAATSTENAAPPVTQVEGLDIDDNLLAQGAQPAQQPAREPQADLRRRLNLTDEQARRVEQVMAGFRSRTEQLRINLARARLDAREALLQATPDRARLDTIARRIGELEGQLTQARFGMLLELKTILTPEQWSRVGLLDGPRGRFRRGR